MVSRGELQRRHRLLREAMESEGIDALVAGASAQLDQRGLLRWLFDYYLPVFEEYAVIPWTGRLFFSPITGAVPPVPPKASWWMTSALFRRKTGPGTGGGCLRILSGNLASKKWESRVRQGFRPYSSGPFSHVFPSFQRTFPTGRRRAGW